MSIPSKMKNIADKIRTICGVSGKMSADAMAENLGNAETALQAAYTAVANKNGTIPEKRTIGNLAEAIGTVSTGIEVQRKTGTFQTSDDGSAYVICDFQPDLVFLHKNTTDKNTGLLFSVSMAFAEETRTGSVGQATSLLLLDNSYNYRIYTERDWHAFFVVVERYDSRGNLSAAKGQTFNYSAVKYT